MTQGTTRWKLSARRGANPSLDAVGNHLEELDGRDGLRAPELRGSDVPCVSVLGPDDMSRETGTGMRRGTCDELDASIRPGASSLYELAPGPLGRPLGNASPDSQRPV